MKTIADKITVNENSTLRTSYPRLQHTKQSFRWKTVNEWNKLPISLRAKKTLPQ